MEAMPTVSSSVEKLPQIPHISLTQRHQTIRHPEKCSKPENDAICGLGTLNRYGSHYVGHPTRDVYGVEQNTGALGHGLAVAVGIALAGKMDRKDYRVFTLLGDGELAEGSNWEAAMTAAHYRLDNLTVIVDRNDLQLSGPTEEVVQLEPLDKKFEA